MKLTNDFEVPGAVGYKRTKDGKAVVYTRQDGENTELWMVPLLGGEPKKLLEIEQNRRDEFGYDLSTDGRLLAVYFGGHISLFSVHDGQPERMASSPEFPSGALFSSLHWSPTGQSLALVLWLKDGDAMRRHIFSASVHDDKWAELGAGDTGDKYSLDWSPDGKWIAYSSDGAKKTRPASVIWAVDIGPFLQAAAKNATAGSRPAEG
jgi:Tol biopolymer transport system component